jgi:SecD/SecF fusion protein
MQNKGLITVFAVLLALVCLYQLSFTAATRMAEGRYAELKADDPAAAEKYLEDFRYPVFGFDYKYCKRKEIQLGLDLKGGMNVTLEVSLHEMLKGMANNSNDATFNKALDMATERQVTSQEDYITLFANAFNEIDPNARLASPAIYGYTLKDKITGDATNEQVIEVLRAESETAIDQAFKVLRTRIDKFGVTQPNIQRLAGSGRILVELPGISEPERVRKLLQGTAKLEFWETYENSDVYGALAEADKVLAAMKAAEAPAKTDSASADPLAGAADTTSASTDPLAMDSDTTGADPLATDSGKASSDTSMAKKAEDAAKTNPLFAIMSPAASQQGLAPGPVVGYAQIRDTAMVNKYLSNDRVKAVLPRDLRLYWTVKPIGDKENILQLVAVKVKSRDGVAPLTGDAISDARQDFDQLKGSAQVDMMMNAEGASTWKRLTAENVGKSIAIVLDDLVYSFPTVQQEISGGRSNISGNFTIDEAKDLANVLQAGRLPAPAKIVEEAIVGPTLGSESVSAGMWSFIGAIILVMAFMVFYYNNSGMAANVALFANIFFIIGVLASLGAVLTLPGIAGIVLTIGMAVDANVLIFERVREELRKGTGVRLAISQGFDGALSAIIDSNVTSLLTAIILYVFGAGPIQGFATTFMIGIFCSLFSAIFITRIILEYQLDAKREPKFSTAMTDKAFIGFNFDFIGKRRIAYMVSGAIIVLGIGSMVTRGFNLGVDFLGGRSYVVSFSQELGTEAVAKALTAEFGAAPTVKTFGGNDRMKIVTSYRIGEVDATVDEEVETKLINGLNTLGEVNPKIMSSQKLEAAIANDIKTAAFWSVMFALIVIFLYIFIRFKKWQFSAGAVIALAHDVLVILGAFSIFYSIMPFSMEIDQAFIAAILTVVGYSINDTVVVFDRIREYMAEHQATKHKLGDVINGAVNQTLSRTTMTSFTTFLVLLVLFIFGGETIKGFSFALLVGVVVGTYSSIFIASPIIVEFMKDKPALDKK